MDGNILYYDVMGEFTRRRCVYRRTACGCSYVRTRDINMDSRLDSSSERTTGQDVDSVDSGITLKQARNEGECGGCTRYTVVQSRGAQCE